MIVSRTVRERGRPAGEGAGVPVGHDGRGAGGGRAALPVPAWLEGRGGQPEGYCHHVMIDAVRYATGNGIKWRSMPVGFPAWDRVYAFFRRWHEKGLVREFHAKFHCVMWAR